VISPLAEQQTLFKNAVATPVIVKYLVKLTPAGVHTPHHVLLKL
jgi:hypothetical protein